MTGAPARQPRSVVKVNGQAIAALKGWSWDGNTMFQADTFSVEFTLWGLPSGNDAAWFAGQTSLDIEIFVGWPQDPQDFTDADLESIFQGRVDDVDLGFERGVLRLTGRDRTADLIDNKTSDKFPNKTSSEIATILAGRRGLTPKVTATKTKVGVFYKDDHVRLEDDRTEWDLLTWLARQEGFVTYVIGNELHFEPRSTSGKPYAITWTKPQDTGFPSLNASSLSTQRTLTVARDIKVTVKSWNHKKKKAFTVTAERSRKSASKGGGKVQQYSYTLPGLTLEQAQQRANALLADISRHEMKLALSGPADNDLNKASLIQLSGTGTAFDQTYHPDSIQRSYDASGRGNGYGWRVTAKNTSPESAPTL